MATLIDFKDCGKESIRGTAKPECSVITERLKGFIAVPKTWELDTSSETLDNAYITQKIQERVFHPFLDSTDFVENNEDSVFQTGNATGIQKLVRKGLPQFDFTYQNDYCWNAAVSHFDSFDRYNVILVYSNDVFGFAYKADGVTITGLETGYIHIPTYKNNDGTVSSSTMIKIQLTKPDQYNKDMALLPASDNNIDMTDIVGILDAKLLPTVAVDLSTDISVSVTVACNSGIQVLGLDETNFVVTGKTVSAAVYNVTTKQYDLTVTAFASGDKITVSLTDGVYSSVDIAGVLYSGSSAEQTVV